MENQFYDPPRDQIAPQNQPIFDKPNSAIGFVPNLYAAFAHSENALGTYVQFQNAPSSLSKKGKEAINLVVSEINNCRYCWSTHTVTGKMNDFTDEQIIEIRKGAATFNQKPDALVKFAKSIAEQKGRIKNTTVAFFAAAYTKGNAVDSIITIADKVTVNYLHNRTSDRFDFPMAETLPEKALAVPA